MPKILLLLYNNPKGYFYQGETVNGFCKITNVDKKVEISSIKVEFLGVTNVQWTLSNLKRERRRQKEQCEHQVRIITPEPMTVGHTDQCWPFSFPIDYDSPPSFESRQGSIRYSVKAEVYAEGRKAPIGRVVIPLTIKSVQDNVGEEFLASVHASFEKKVKRFPLVSGSVAANIQLDRSSYCKHDVILLSGVVDNKSNKRLTMLVYLVKETVFSANDDLNRVEEQHPLTPIACARSLDTPIAAREQRELTDVLFLLVVPSPTLHSPLIAVNYFVEIKLVGQFLKPMLLRMPVLIGTVPDLERSNTILEDIIAATTTIPEPEPEPEDESEQEPVEAAAACDGDDDGDDKEEDKSDDGGQSEQSEQAVGSEPLEEIQEDDEGDGDDDKGSTGKADDKKATQVA